MAIFHLTQKFGSRSGGQSALAKIRYVLREGKYACQRDKLVHSEWGNMPAWANSSTDYWDSVDTYERANAKLFFEIEFALPKELSESERILLAKAFADHVANKPSDIHGPLPYTLALHAGGDKNPHAHLVLHERGNDGLARNKKRWFKRADSKSPANGGAKKTRALQPKKWLVEVRKEWAEIANSWLTNCGHDAQIDHRSLEGQGIDLPAQIHVGPHASALEKKGVLTDRGELNRQSIAARQLLEKLRHERRLIDESKILLEEQLGKRLPEQKIMSKKSQRAAKNGKISDGSLARNKRENWKKKLLSEQYGQAIEASELAKYWKVERLEDGALKLKNKAGQVIDRGGVIDVSPAGNTLKPSAAAALEVARLKGWDEVRIDGSDEFKKVAFMLANQADIHVKIESENDRTLWQQAVGRQVCSQTTIEKISILPAAKKGPSLH